MIQVNDYVKSLLEADESEDVWSIFSRLSAEHKTINLGQGFPNFAPPKVLLDSIQEAISSPLQHQYPPSQGVLSLRRHLSNLLSPKLNRTICPSSEIMITQGANQALLAIFQTFLKPNDVVLAFSPVFVDYEPMITMNGGVLRCVPYDLNPEALKKMRTNGTVDVNELFRLPMQALRDVVREVGRENCKFLLLNTPNNPTGKVFTREELNELAEFVENETDAMVISDEVYEQLVLEGDHIPFACIRDGSLFDRTITVGSAGKTFGITGWRIGWSIAPQPVIDAMMAIHSRTIFCANSPLQYALANAFEVEGGREVMAFLDQQRIDYLRRREILCGGLRNAGIEHVKPNGAYYVMASLNTLLEEFNEWHKDHPNLVKCDSEPLDYSICRYLCAKRGVTAMPISAFFLRDEMPASYRELNFVRMCFAKTESTLHEASNRLI